MADGHYDGKPNVLDQFQTLENDALRAKLGVPKSVRGLLVREPYRREPSYPLKEFDIVTRIGTYEIDNEGMIQAQDNLRLSFVSQLHKLVREGAVPVTVVRDGKAVEVALPVSRDPGRLFRGYEGRYPSYFVCGPLVFSPVVADAVSVYARGNPQLMNADFRGRKNNQPFYDCQG